MAKQKWFEKLEKKVIALDEIKVKRPIQVMLDYIDYMELKQFCSKYDTTISESIRSLILEHLEAVAKNEIDVKSKLN